jgi:hypothetical protein
MRNNTLKTCSIVVAMSLLLPPPPPPSAFAQAAAPAPASAPTPDAAAKPTDASTAAFNPEQIDALLAPIALYPDTLLVQVLMTSTFPLQIVTASRWLAEGDNKSLTGDALAAAVEKQTWDPSVMSLVPFPQVLAMMNDKLDWTQQLGYAFATQQGDVMDSVQRLRQQAQAAGNLKTNDQQVVQSVAVVDDQGAPTAQQSIVIQPANPQVIYVPTYNPTVVYGTWPYPASPPVYLPPPPGYGTATAFVNGMAFMAGAAVVGSLWGWATPRWGCCGGYGHGGRYGYGTVNVNVNHYNNISRNSINRAPLNGNTWRPASPGVAGRPVRPPGGPVGAPSRGNGLPANAVGRPSVTVPAAAVNRPNIGSGGNKTNIGQVNIGGGNNANRTNVGNNVGVNRPNVGNSATAKRPNVGGGAGTANRPVPVAGKGPAAVTQRPAVQQNRAAVPPKSALSGVGDGKRAGQYQSRGSQSRSVQQRQGSGGQRAIRG